MTSNSSLLSPQDQLQSGGSGLVADLDPNPENWSVMDVVFFLKENDCASHCESMEKAKVNGKQLLKMSKDDFIMVLNKKVGPALKIFELVQQLKEGMEPSSFGGKRK